MIQDHHYILLPDHTVKVVPLMEWAQWFEWTYTGKHDRKVEKTQITDGVEVSTMFLWLDHQFGVGPPILFETMIFGWEHDQYTERYATWDEAVAGHKKAVDIATLAAN